MPYGMNPFDPMEPAPGGIVPGGADVSPYPIEDVLKTWRDYYGQLPPTRPARLGFGDRLALALGNMQPGPPSAHPSGFDTVLRTAAALARGYGLGRGSTIQQRQAGTAATNQRTTEQAAAVRDAKLKAIEDARELVKQRIVHGMSPTQEARIPVTADEAKKNPEFAPYVGRSLSPTERSTVSTANAEKLGPGEKAYQTEKGRQRAQAEAAGGVTDEEATYFAKTGAFLNQGRGNMAVLHNRGVAARAKALYPNIDIATNSADYKANVKSLNQRSVQRDALVAFDRTAQRNAGQLRQTLKGIPDTPSSWINKPLRNVDLNALSGDDLAAYNTFVLSVSKEYARIIDNPNLTGVLSVQASQELQHIVNKDFSAKRMVSVLDALQTEAQNRIDESDAIVKEIRDRIGLEPGTFVAPKKADGKVIPQEWIKK